MYHVWRPLMIVRARLLTVATRAHYVQQFNRAFSFDRLEFHVSKLIGSDVNLTLATYEFHSRSYYIYVHGDYALVRARMRAHSGLPQTLRLNDMRIHTKMCGLLKFANMHRTQARHIIDVDDDNGIATELISFTRRCPREMMNSRFGGAAKGRRDATDR